MMTTRNVSLKMLSWCVAAALLLALTLACSQPPPEKSSRIKKLPKGQEFSGFLKDYSQLKPDPELGSSALTYVNQDQMKNLRHYVAMIVDPVQVYVATNVKESEIPQGGPEAAANYFHYALVKAVADAYPIADEPSPLVLRLRAAIVGVDLGGKVDETPEEAKLAPPLERALDIRDIWVEVELVDSVTGERIAAAVDKADLGEGALIGAKNFSRVERFELAEEAFDGWAERLRLFLDQANQISETDAERAAKVLAP